MTRIRYVGGKIVETTGGDYNIYAKENIVYNSNKVISETGEKGISYGKPENAPAPPIIPKCLVEFRPHGKYNGEYGFDWLRAGDTGQKGDIWFGKIMGKYYENDDVTVFQDGNSWNKNPKHFHKDLKMYNKLLNTYKSLNISWKDYFEGKSKKKKPYLYPIPTLTILKGESAILNLKIEIRETPKKLTIEFKDPKASEYLATNISQIGDVKKGKYEKFDYLKITCIKSFSTDQVLYIKADGQICGALKIHPNTNAFRKNINVVFVKVETDINSIPITGNPIVGGKDFFKKCLNQALVIPNVEEVKINCKGGFFSNPFKTKFCTLNNTKFEVTKSAGMKEYLEEKLKDQFGDKYKGFYTVFFIGDTASWNGFSYYNSTFGVYFATHNKATIAHETFHAMSLAHTFNGIDPTAKFTYEAMKTDNIMDYSHNATPPINRKVLYLWQWKILNNKII